MRTDGTASALEAKAGGKSCFLSPGDREVLADCGWEVLCVPKSWKHGKD